jgi:hypothetical protein
VIGCHEIATCAAGHGGAYGVRVIANGEKNHPSPAELTHFGEQRKDGAIGKTPVDDQQLLRGLVPGSHPGLGRAGGFDDVSRAERAKAGCQEGTPMRRLRHEQHGEARPGEGGQSGTWAFDNSDHAGPPQR